MHPLLNTAVKAARRAGNIIVRNYERADSVKISQKKDNDFVTEVDIFAENEIKDILKTAYPDHAILAEESGRDGNNDFLWIIDPLDGTTNFAHQFPHFAVSVALQVKGKLEHAVIYDPIKQELFTASNGGGAFLDGRRLRVKNRKNLQGALIGTGFPFKNKEILDQYIDTFKDIFSESAGVRRAGAASLDLAYVAAGRLDGFWEAGLKPWDIAAGALLVIEAGGVVTDFSGNGGYLDSGNTVAGNIKLHNELINKISAGNLS
ncbi:MAG: inositol-1-monophosphatase [Gammaproteobacteria bacterium]|nr:MAG: inositol-1-monophosphatase [Gammaproteobacteria bacterium]